MADFCPKFSNLKVAGQLGQVTWPKFALGGTLIQGAKYQPKTAKKKLPQPKSELLKKRDYINFLILKGFSIKISEEIENWKFCFVKKFSTFYRNILDPDPFFPSADPGSASKLNGS